MSSLTHLSHFHFIFIVDLWLLFVDWCITITRTTLLSLSLTSIHRCFMLSVVCPGEKAFSLPLLLLYLEHLLILRFTLRLILHRTLRLTLLRTVVMGWPKIHHLFRREHHHLMQLHRPPHPHHKNLLKKKNVYVVEKKGRTVCWFYRMLLLITGGYCNNMMLFRRIDLLL